VWVDVRCRIPAARPAFWAGLRTPGKRRWQIFAEVLSRTGHKTNRLSSAGTLFLAQPLIAKVNAARHRPDGPVAVPGAHGRALIRESAKGAEESAADSLRQLLPLRSTGTKLPLFAVHPASGISWGYASMLGKLDPERPLIGLQMPGMEPGRTHPVEAATLTDLADDYIAQLRSVQPEGP
jgi:hypothetical protein